MVNACVWLEQGFLRKVLGLDGGRHRAIVANIARVGRYATLVTTLVGLGETAIGLWVISKQKPRAAAAVQTGLVATMNAGGLLWARSHISHPFRLLSRNAAFVFLAWYVARDASSA